MRSGRMRQAFVLCGVAASVVLIAFGIGSIVVGFDGRSEVRTSLGEENIVGTDDSTIPGQKVDTGDEAKAFATVMRKHVLEATGGKSYADLPRYATEDGNGTNDEEAALKDAKGQPVGNPLRQLWVTETALTTALNQAFFAERVATFSIAMGFALLLTGIGFLVVVSGVLWRWAGASSQKSLDSPPAGGSAS